MIFEDYGRVHQIRALKCILRKSGKILGNSMKSKKSRLAVGRVDLENLSKISETRSKTSIAIESPPLLVGGTSSSGPFSFAMFTRV